ncbi:thioredoxin [Streptomyces eurocidicus]|uniref:Thioredoxin n=1 Tax=Streptomyces eurocidicus TaxID=66423 RepID=A0A2N8NY52_STREU|nr:thioredoxin [Streptomyces eurocidicus]MBB5119811.1 thioredoxin 1 [Streptomyces eurocidicus]MBF6050830.1 thioredoxin [Streptomyces eurocidicus]PNE33693.1 thioredoxin [Streptomyces eurocidicus]
MTTAIDATSDSHTTFVPSVTDDTFASEVLDSDLPVLVDFTASWCPPCRMIAPVLADIAREQAGRLRIVQLDVDANPRTQAAYGVLSMPTLLLFRAGEPVKSLVGAHPKRRLLQHLATELPWLEPR